MSSESSTEQSYAPYPLTYIPKGFECVAHPCFFVNQSPGLPCTRHRIQITPDSEQHAKRREETSSSISINTASTRESTVTQGAKLLGVGGIQRSSVACRVAEIHCPICLTLLTADAEPITLVSCCHTYCHNCILSWFAHVKAGDFGSTTASFRCPLCKGSCTHYLHVDSKSHNSEESEYRLYGVNSNSSQTDTSHGASVCKTEELPPLESLRNAVIVQRAILNAVQLSLSKTKDSSKSDRRRASSRPPGGHRKRHRTEKQQDHSSRSRSNVLENISVPGESPAEDALLKIEEQLEADMRILAGLDSSREEELRRQCFIRMQAGSTKVTNSSKIMRGVG